MLASTTERWWVEIRQDGVLIETVSTAGGTNNTLLPPTPPHRSPKVFEGSSTIGQFVFRVVDKRLTASDQRTGRHTYGIAAADAVTGSPYNGWLRGAVTVFREVNGGAPERVFTGTIQSVKLATATEYEVVAKDTRSEEKTKLFDRVYPLAATEAEFESRGWGYNGVVMHRAQGHRGGALFHPWAKLHGIGSLNIHRDWHVVESIDTSSTEAVIGFMSALPLTAGAIAEWAGGAELRLAHEMDTGEWEQWAGTVVDYETNSDGDITSITAQGKPGAFQVPPASYLDSADRRRAVLRPGGVKPSDDCPFHIGGKDGIHPITLLRQILDGVHGAHDDAGNPTTALPYNQVELDRLEQDLDPETGEPLSHPFPRVWFRITEVEDDRLEWVEKNILFPFDLWPIVQGTGEITYRSLLSASLDPEQAPTFELNARTLTAAKVSQGLKDALNVVRYKIRPPRGHSDAGGDGVAMDAEQTIQYSAPSIEKIGEQAGQDIELEAGWVNPDTIVIDYMPYLVEQLRPYADRKFRLLQWGPYAVSLEALKHDIQGGHHPRLLEEGDVVQLDSAVLPSLRFGRRGLYGRLFVTRVQERKAGVDISGIVWLEDLRATVLFDAFRHEDGDTVFLDTTWEGANGDMEIEYELAQLEYGVQPTDADWQGVRKTSAVEDFVFDVTQTLDPSSPWWLEGRSIWLRARLRVGTTFSRWWVCSPPVYRIQDMGYNTSIEVIDNGDGTGTPRISWTPEETHDTTPRGHAIKTRILFAQGPTDAFPASDAEYQDLGLFARSGVDVDLPVLVQSGNYAFVKLWNETAEGEDRKGVNGATRTMQPFIGTGSAVAAPGEPTNPQLTVLSGPTGYQLLGSWTPAGEYDTEVEVAYAATEADLATAVPSYVATVPADGSDGYTYVPPSSGWYRMRFRHVDASDQASQWVWTNNAQIT